MRRKGLAGAAAAMLWAAGAAAIAPASWAQESTKESADAKAAAAKASDDQFFCVYDNIEEATIIELSQLFFDSSLKLGDKPGADIQKASAGCAKKYGWDAKQIAMQREISATAAVLDIATDTIEHAGFKDFEKLDRAFGGISEADAKAMLKNDWANDKALFARVQAAAKSAGVGDKEDQMGPAVALAVASIRADEVADRWDSYKK